MNPFIKGNIFDNLVIALNGDDILWSLASNGELHGDAGDDYLDGYFDNAFSQEYNVLTGSSLNIFQ